MIGHIVTDEKTGIPLDGNGNKLSKSGYQLPFEIARLFARVQTDYQTAYTLQHRAFDEFDGYSLLQRSKMDQETFAAFVGCEWLPVHKRWRWRGRKNTARNKLIGLCARLIAGMLYPYVRAQNKENEQDAMTAQAMRILVEEKLRKAKYEVKFLFMVLSALVNPAVFVQVEYVTAMQTVKQRLSDGTIKVVQAVDELLSGLNVNVIPIDEVMLADYYTFDLQHQPYIIRQRRISYDVARKMYAGKFKYNGKDLFDFVEAGKTRILGTGNENQTLFDVEWTEADSNFVQEVTIQYRGEDLQLKYVGGVGLFNYDDPYNSNAFTHRRMSIIADEYISIPVYNIAKSGFEPIDPAGRFAFYKSGAFKEYWDYIGENRMDALMMDGSTLDVMKPIFLSGLAKADSTVMVPGATIAMPMGASVNTYQLGPNLAATINAMKIRMEALADSTQDKIMNGQMEAGVTATQTNAAITQARIFLGVFGIMMAQLIKDVGEMTVDCVIQHETIGELDATLPESLKMKFKTIVSRSKEKGKEVLHKIIFDDSLMGREISQQDKETIQWGLYNKNGGQKPTAYEYRINPYKFARTQFSLYVDADKIVMQSMGMDAQQKQIAFAMMTDPRVAPFTDPQAVAEDFVIEEYGGSDPDRYKRKDTGHNDMLNSIMSQPGGVPSPYNSGQVDNAITIPGGMKR